MTFVPGRIAYLGNNCGQRLLFIKAVKNIDGAKIETKMPQLRQHAYRPPEQYAGLLPYQFVNRIHYRYRSVAKVIISPERGRSEATSSKAPTCPDHVVNLCKIQIGP